MGGKKGRLKVLSPRSGRTNGYNLWEAPDNVSMAGVAIAIGSGGALSKCETTPLLAFEETLDALGRVPGDRVQAARSKVARPQLQPLSNFHCSP